MPAVAGMFYPDNRRELESQIQQSFLDFRFGPGRLPPSGKQRKVYGIVSPHAGYQYSGAVAANGYYEVSSLGFENAVMVGPNHYGIGSGIAAFKEGEWETPLGSVSINAEFASQLARESGVIDFDDFAHSRDHCLEVQVPFLQFLNKNIQIVPVVLIMQDIDTAYSVGEAIADTVSDSSQQALIIASSDLTHYEPNEDAHRKDSELIKPILSLDVSKFYAVLERLDVSACGYGAIASAMVAAKRLGATKGELLRYATSGDVTGDRSAVVGYSSIVFV